MARHGLASKSSMKGNHSMLQYLNVCPLCESINLKNLYSNVNDFTIVRCLECRLVFVKERLSTEKLLGYYEADKDNPTYSDPANIANLNYYFNRLRSIIEARVRPGRVLDIGCSAGYFLDTMRGWDCYGIEIPSTWADVARGKYGRNIHIGSLEDAEFPENYFDVIAFQDVFDHLPSPMDYLQACNRLLRPGGLVVIKVHNISCLFARLSGRRFYAMIPPYHLFYFNETTLKMALNKAGFEHEMTTFIAQILFLKTIPLRMARARREGLFYRAFQVLDRLPVGTLTIRKNLHDIITVIGTKRPGFAGS